MDYATRDETPARTQRFLRELHRYGPGFDDSDPEVRQWRRVGALFSVAGTGLILSLLLWAALATSGIPPG